MNNFRYERKYFIQNIDFKTIVSIIYNNKAQLQPIHKERWINNIYFDYLNFRNFMDNINGNTFRGKYRIRWYGNMYGEIGKPILEKKIKNGLIGKKDSFKLKPLNFYNGINSQIIKNHIIESVDELKLTYEMKNQFPVMLNRYKRRYFLSSDGNFRITLDDSMMFFKFSRFNNSFINKIYDKTNCILEIKYNNEHDLEADSISENLPFRLTKSSKYARGIELIYFK